MNVCVLCSQKSKEHIRSPRTGVADGSKPLCWGWELNPDPLKRKSLSNCWVIAPTPVSVGLNFNSMDFKCGCNFWQREVSTTEEFITYIFREKGQPHGMQEVWPEDSTEYRVNSFQLSGLRMSDGLWHTGCFSWSCLKTGSERGEYWPLGWFANKGR